MHPGVAQACECFKIWIDLDPIVIIWMSCVMFGFACIGGRSCPAAGRQGHEIAKRSAKLHLRSCCRDMQKRWCKSMEAKETAELVSFDLHLVVRGGSLVWFTVAFTRMPYVDGNFKSFVQKSPATSAVGVCPLVSLPQLEIAISCNFEICFDLHARYFG